MGLIRTKIGFVAVLVLVMIAAVAAYGAFLWNTNISIASSSGSITIEIPLGSGISETADSLVKYGVVPNRSIAQVFLLIERSILQRGIRAGIYEFSSGESVGKALDKLFIGGAAQTLDITIPEGMMLGEVASLMETKLQFDSAAFIRAARNPRLREKYSLDAGLAEGIYWPDTYNVFKNSSADEIAEKLVSTFSRRWIDLYKDEANKQGRSMSEILTLASIVEAETPVDREKPRVAGVYANRLRIRMPLQADPTVQYALGSRKKLYYKDLELKNPYNTYVYPGLPPGPINSPGDGAIRAALRPEAHSYLYFVANGDGSETHTFSKTLNEHIKAVQTYRKRKQQ